MEDCDPDVGSILARAAATVEGYLRDRLPVVGGFADVPPVLVEAMNYSLLAGGKRLRPALALETARVCGDAPAAVPAAAAVEIIHTFSLVHDDLPAMDDDDLRRGRPTSHKVYGEATAILAGDAMTTLAFEVLAAEYPPPVAVRLVGELARATGPAGMIGGQILDLAAQTRDTISLDELKDLHARKTGALLAAAVRMGALAAGCDDAPLEVLTRFGRSLGLAFQIADDLLDATGTSDDTGKRTGKDEAAGKKTFPHLLGIDAARRTAADEAARAGEALSCFGDEADGLRALATFTVERTR